MGQYLSPEEIYKFIVTDFEDAWNSLASNPLARGRGNFMFGLQAMILLEFASRLCSSDSSGAAIGDLSQALSRIERKYFTCLPAACPCPRRFDLPTISGRPDELLCAIFDLVRNGEAHQYQQILAKLLDNVNFGVSLTGAQLGRHMSLASGSGWREGRLEYERNGHGDLWLIVCPEVLFLDLKNAIAASGLLSRGLKFAYLGRAEAASSSKAKSSPPYYAFDSAALEKSLATGGHKSRAL